jgi:lipopolysaccharide export system protein LptA
MYCRSVLVSLLFLGLPGSLAAQGTQVAFGTVQQNDDLPVEVTSENLAVDQNAGTAIFTDNVIVVQGEMRLSADRVVVIYDTVLEIIDRIEATGNVILISGEDAAEAERAFYNMGDRTIDMFDNVLVAQGPSTITSDQMTVHLNDGTAQMTGRVRTILQSGKP